MPSVVRRLSAAPLPPPPPPPPLVKAGMVMGVEPPSSLRISNGRVPATLTVNVGVKNAPPVVDREVPTWVNELPPLVDENRPQVPLASELKLAWWMVTVPAPVVRSNRMVIQIGRASCR